MTCRNCGGSGRAAFETKRLTPFSYRIVSRVRCHQCAGTGRIQPKKGK